MRVFILFIGFLFITTFPCLLVAYSQITEVSGTPKKIYLKDLSIDPIYRPKSRGLEKNIYDIIYEVNRYQLLLTDESNRNAAFIQNYERLTVDLQKDFVEVSLSNKVIVRRRYESSHPIMDMRLALYELFYGKDFVNKNKDALKKRNQQRMNTIDRLMDKQDKIAAKKKTGPNKTRPNPSPKASSTNQSPPVKPNRLESNKSENNDEDEVAKPAVLNKPEKNKDPKNALKGISKSSSDLNQKKDNARNLEGSSKLKTPPPPSHFNFLKSESSTRTSVHFGYMYLKGENDEIIDTITNLNFITLGARITKLLKKEGKDGFWANLDYEGRFQLSKNTSSDGGKFDAKLGRKLEGYMGKPILDRWFGYGGTLSFENVQVGSLKNIGQGLTIANINAFFLGPELRLKGEFLKRELHFFLGYGYAIFHNSSIKSASYTLDKTYLDLTLYNANQWGYGIGLEKFDGIGKRGSLLGNSRFEVYQGTVKVLYQF